MLSAVFKFPLPEISTSPILKDLIRSFEISAPRPLFPPPPWDLDKVLQYLSGPPFEPLARASFLDKTKKALFLLAMATAKRVSELQALSFSVSFQGEDLVLYYDPFFCAKMESASNPLPRSVIVPSLSDFAGDLPERVQCPVRAIKFLRKAARSASYIPSRLFVSPRNLEGTMSKNAMSFYLRQLIVDSGAVSTSRPPRAHDIRGIATSLNYYSNLSLSNLMQVATWKSNHVFACLMSVSLQFRVFQRGVQLISRVLFCLMPVSLQFRPGVEFVNRGLFCLMSANLFLLIPRLRGSPSPLHCFLTLPNQFSGSPQRPYLAKPLIGLSPAMKGSSICRKHSAPLVRRLLHFALAAFVCFNLFWILPHRLPGNCRMLGYRHHGLGFRRLPSLARPKWVLLVLRRPKWVLIVQSRPQWVLVAQSSTLLSLVRLGDGLLTRLSVPRTTHLTRGVILPPARGVGSLAIRLTRTHRPRIANNGMINRTKRIIFVLPHWTFC